MRGRSWPVPAGAAVTIAVVSLATGVFTSGSAVYLLVIGGLDPLAIGAGASAAGLAAVLMQLPAGYLADRFPRRPLWSIALGLAALMYLAYPLVSDLSSYMMVVVPATAAVTVATVAKSRWVGDWFRGADRVRASAFLRALQNGGYAVGAGIVAVLFAVAGDTAAVALPVASALMLSAGAIVVLVTVQDLPPGTSQAQASTRKSSAWRDRPFLSLSLVNAFPMVNDVLLLVALPLWAVSTLGAPGWLVPVSLFINTVLVVALQVSVGRRVAGLRSGARAQALAGLLIGAGCAVAAAAALQSPGSFLVVMLIFAVVLLTFGELVEAAAAWGICYSLAPDTRRGEYVAVYGLGAETMRFVAPFAVVALIGVAGAVGWLLVGGVVVFACVLSMPLASWARHHAHRNGTFTEELIA